MRIDASGPGAVAVDRPTGRLLPQDGDGKNPDKAFVWVFADRASDAAQVVMPHAAFD